MGRRTSADWNKTLPRRLHVLHVSLMSGKAGGRIVGLVTASALFLVITGVIIWWREKRWRVRWSASWKRVLFDLHHTLGVGAALVITIIAASGMAIHYETLNRLIYSFDRTPPPDIPDQPAPAAGASQISADSLYRVALAALPGARVMFLSIPPKSDQPLVAAMRFPEDRTPGGRSRVYVDRFAGRTTGGRQHSPGGGGHAHGQHDSLGAHRRSVGQADGGDLAGGGAHPGDAGDHRRGDVVERARRGAMAGHRRKTANRADLARLRELPDRFLHRRGRLVDVLPRLREQLVRLGDQARRRATCPRATKC